MYIIGVLRRQHLRRLPATWLHWVAPSRSVPQLGDLVVDQPAVKEVPGEADPGPRWDPLVPGQAYDCLRTSPVNVPVSPTAPPFRDQIRKRALTKAVCAALPLPREPIPAVPPLLLIVINCHVLLSI